MCHAVAAVLKSTYVSKGPFINYVRVPREGGGRKKYLHTLTLERGGQTHSYVIFFQVDILY